MKHPNPFKLPLNLKSHLGFDPRKPWSLIRNLPWYLSDYRKLKAQAAASEFKFPFGRPFPFLTEKHDQSDSALGHYFLQDLHVARRIHALKPERHVDVGSRIDGFVAHVASFREIEVFGHPPAGHAAPGRHLPQGGPDAAGRIPDRMHRLAVLPPYDRTLRTGTLRRSGGLRRLSQGA